MSIEMKLNYFKNINNEINSNKTIKTKLNLKYQK